MFHAPWFSMSAYWSLLHFIKDAVLPAPWSVSMLPAPFSFLGNATCSLEILCSLLPFELEKMCSLLPNYHFHVSCSLCLFRS